MLTCGGLSLPPSSLAAGFGNFYFTTSGEAYTACEAARKARSGYWVDWGCHLHGTLFVLTNTGNMCPNNRFAGYFYRYDDSVWTSGVDNFFYCYDQCPKGTQWDATAKQCVTVCPEDQKWDTTTQQCLPRCTAPEKWNTKTKQCEVECPVYDLTTDHEKDACAKSLEDGQGTDIYKACLMPEPNIMSDPNGWDCLVRKAKGLGLSGSYIDKPESSIRNPAYAKHFDEIWTKWQRLLWLEENKPDEYAACVAKGVVGRIKHHKDEWHHITHAPTKDANNDSHIDGKAVDTGNNLYKDMQDKLDALTCSSAPPCWLEPFCEPEPSACKSIQGYLDDDYLNGPACNLRWGGTFPGKKYDPPHWQTR